MTAGIYSERDAQRVVVLRSDDDGVSWVPDTDGLSEPVRTQRYDLSGSDLYVGSAPLGADETDPVWAIKRVELSGGTPTTAMWAQNVAWDDRTTEEYS